MLAVDGSRLSTSEREFLSFAKNAESGATYVYAHSSGPKPVSTMRLAMNCSEQGLVHLVQRRDAFGLAYVAIKRDNKVNVIKGLRARQKLGALR
jgi:hypothetical protein